MSKYSKGLSKFLPVSFAVAAMGLGVVLVSPTAAASGPDGPTEIYSPFEGPTVEVHEYDMEKVVGSERGQYIAVPPAQPDLASLGEVDDFASQPAANLDKPSELPEEFIQIGEVVQYKDVALGLKQVSPYPTDAYNEKPGNEYPRKHTVFLNFNGGVLIKGSDNSAINKSSLARHNENYPQYGGSEASALALIQSVTEDLSPLGVRVMYASRPNQTVPYTMCMIGGSWTDTTIDSPAGGVAPGTDCEARSQRHVVYAFGNTSSSTISQEIAHAWGLDHILGFDMIMSYQGSGNKDFASECRNLCEEQCQGPGTIGCRLTHEKYCGVGSEKQWDYEELGFIFGTNEEDTEPPTVTFISPQDGDMLEAGANVEVRIDVTDNYGGYGWKVTIAQDGEVVLDEVDYDRAAAWNLNKLPAGVYDITIEAEDHFDHIVKETVTIYVGTEAPATTGDDSMTATAGDDDDDDGGGSDGGAGDDDDDDNASAGISGGETGTDTAFDTMGDDKGCGCSASSTESGGAASLALLAGLMLFRRRRQ